MGYEIYGLKDNCFPSDAILKPGSEDPRQNGLIFSVNARAKEIEEFEKKFMGKKTSFNDRYRCGFLWAEGGRTIGRGMGKTALALYMQHRINNGYGENYFDGKEKFFLSYVSFSQQIKSKVAFLYKAILGSFITEKLFEHVSNCVTRDKLIENNVRGAFAEAIVNNQVKGYLESRSKYPLDVMTTAYDRKFLQELPYIFLSDTVKSLKVAGFKGGIILIDDIENLTDRSTGKEIETFIKDIGIAFLRDATSEAVKSNFYTIILTTHEQSAQKISQAWTVAGLSASFPLAAGGRASLLTRKPDMPECLDIIQQYLKYYRDPSFTPPEEFYPFKREATETIIKECDFHPRRFLSSFNRILIEALSNNVKEITSDFVRTVPEVEEEESLGIEDL